MECHEGYTFRDAGFIDCTGTCHKKTPEEIERDKSTSSTSSPLGEWDYSPETGAKFLMPDADADSALACKELDPRPETAGTTPTVVMLTTVGQTDDVNKATLQTAAAATWAVQRPNVHVEVAVDTSAVQAPLGLPRLLCPANNAGTPFVTALFRHAEATAVRMGAPFAGYTNGDIGFDATLHETLHDLAAEVEAGLLKKRVLVVGRRLNLFNVTDGAYSIVKAYGDGSGKNVAANVHDRLLHLSTNPKNTWMTPLAEDYFFFTPVSRRRFPRPGMFTSTLRRRSAILPHLPPPPQPRTNRRLPCARSGHIRLVQDPDVRDWSGRVGQLPHAVGHRLRG